MREEDYSPSRQAFHYWFDLRNEWERVVGSPVRPLVGFARIALAIAIDQERAWLYRDPFVRAAMAAGQA